MLSNTDTQKKEVIKMVVAEEEELVISEMPPALPQSITVLEKAIRQKGHLGNSIKNIVVIRPACFLFSETRFLFLHGLQSVTILETVNMDNNNFKSFTH